MIDSPFKRIFREIEYIKNSLPEYRMYEFTEEKDKIISISLYTQKNNFLEFKLPKDYPFKPPLSFTINGENYRYRLKEMPSKIYHLYYHPEKMYMDDRSSMNKDCRPNCLCCNSLLCPANWSPITRIPHILKEIELHNDIKRNIMYKLKLKELFDFRSLPLDLIRNVYVFLL
jgi:hypothetical protein